MRVPGLKRLAVAGRWVRSRIAPRALILGYHRIAHAASDPFSLCVTPDHFAEQMEMLRHHARPVGLGELARALEGGSLPGRAVVVTFDDGYASVLEEAKPRLERWEIPATAFLVSGWLGLPPWWETLERTVSGIPDLPPRGTLEIGGESVAWDLGRERTPRARRRLLGELYWRLRRLDEAGRKAALEALAEEVGPPPGEPPRTMLPTEIEDLVRGDLVMVGSHTVTHADLADLNPERCRAEIHAGKAALERIVGRPVIDFSFPYGSVPAAARQEVRQAGFVTACTSRADVVRPSEERLSLPRFWPSDWDGAKFARWLLRWLGT